MSRQDFIDQLYASIDANMHCPMAADEAHIEIHHNKVLGAHLVPGLEVDAKEFKDGVEARILVSKNAAIAKPVRICFGMLPEQGLQHIVLNICFEENASAHLNAYCTFPNAVQVEHRMDAEITVGKGADYTYFERHVHGPQGGVRVIPKARVMIAEDARFKTEFELIKGGVGSIDIDYSMTCQARGVFEMLARIFGRGDDRIKIHESGRLAGEYARGVLTSHIAVRERAQAEIFNTLIAEAPFARGHVDCKEIVQDQAIAKATPIVEVLHPKAHVTHEAAIGSVDSRQLETLMSRGLTEDAAVDLIIQGMLS
ncbi:MAG: SufD family Fe-S cluster assembly protein [Lentisphaerota bacterium]